MMSAIKFIKKFMQKNLKICVK